MKTVQLGQIASMRYGKLPPKVLLEEGFPIFTGYRVSGYSSEYLYENPMLLVVARGVGGTGDVKISPPKAWITNLSIVLELDETQADKQFMCYYLNQQSLKEKLDTGSAQSQITVGALAAYFVTIPSLRTQRRIASILSAYDDLIENNTRRIAILEEATRRIYEEWFVRFRFPGHQRVKMVESELGLIPEGWGCRLLGTLLEHHIGGGWGEETRSEDFPVAAYVIRGTDIPDVRSTSLGRSPLRFHKESNFRSRKLQARDIVFEVSGGSKDQPVGRSALLRPKLFSTTDQPIICASFCRLVRVDQSTIMPELLQLHFERIYENREILKYQTQSTGITNFKFMVFLEKELVLVPPPEAQDAFASHVMPLFELIATLGVKNHKLRTTRDLLLPKLISGELDVSTLPEPEAVAT